MQHMYSNLGPIVSQWILLLEKLLKMSVFMDYHEKKIKILKFYDNFLLFIYVLNEFWRPYTIKAASFYLT